MERSQDAQNCCVSIFPVNTGQRAVLDPIKMMVEMLDILEVIHNTKTFSYTGASKVWALRLKSYPKESGRSS